MGIRGITNLTVAEVEAAVADGARFVFYEYCISVIVLTLRKPTDIYFLRANDLGLVRGLPYALISLVFGWWGVPWGLVYTPLTLFTNLTGGRDVTADVLARLQSPTDGPHGPGERGQ